MTENPQKRIYLDHAASTPVDPDVLQAMQPYWNSDFANASAIHQEGVAAKRALENARAEVATVLSCQSEEITFVSGGTEANNLGILGVVHAWCREHDKELSDVHLITLSVEHSSVLDCFLELQSQGAQLTLLPVSSEGKLDLAEFRNALQENTVLVSIMQVNSEIGIHYPLSECARVVAEHRQVTGLSYPYLHTDASQGPSYCEVNVQSLGVDLMTLDAQKIYGPKGIGALYHKKHVPLAPVLLGGGQERGLRPGTPAVGLAVGLTKALQLVTSRKTEVCERLEKLRVEFVTSVQENIADAKLNGSLTDSAPHIISFSFLGRDAEETVLRLDSKGIAVSTKSVCKGASGSSHVIAALGKGSEYATSMVRFSMGHATTKEDMERTFAALKEILT